MTTKKLTVAGFAVLATLLPLVAVGSAQAATGKLALVGNPAISIPTQCNPAGGGTGRMKVRNEGPGSVSLNLTATELVSRSPMKRANPRITIFLIAAAPPPATAPTKGEPQSEKKILAPNEEQWLQMDIAEMHEDGEWETILQNDNVAVGPVKVVTYETPFHISMDVPNPDAPELTFEEGQPAYFSLKNDDHLDYTIGWEYSVNGTTVRSSDLPDAESPKQQQSLAPDGKVQIAANAFKQISFIPPRRWFGSCFTGLFKDSVGDGRLMISWINPACASGASITKSFKVKTHLMTTAGVKRELYADFWMFLMLLAGGVCSLVLNSAIPNQMQRVKVKKQLSEAGKQIYDLPNNLASRLRVLAGLEQRLLRDRLQNLTWTNSDFAAEMQSIEQAVTSLTTRIQLLDRLGTTRADFERLRSHLLAPTVISSMEAVFEKIIAIGERSDPSTSDIQTALTMIKNLQDQLDNVGHADDGFTAKLSQQAQMFQLEFDKTNGDTGKTQTCQKIRAILPGLFIQLGNIKPEKISPDTYVDVDTILFKLRILQKYCAVVESLDPNDPDRKALEHHLDPLIALLKIDGWEAMAAAELLVQEIRENQFPKDIEHAITKQMARIKLDRIEVRQFDPCEFKLTFQSSSLDKAAARKEWTCKWDFSHPAETKLTEEGWEITHYFRRADVYTIAVTLIHNESGKELNVADPNFPQIKVLPESRRRISRVIEALFKRRWKEAWTEWRQYRVGAGRMLERLRLLLALFIALIGLMAGAKEQLLKLDVVPALFAIFLVGFGADQVKNLLTQRQQT